MKAPALIEFAACRWFIFRKDSEVLQDNNKAQGPGAQTHASINAGFRQ